MITHFLKLSLILLSDVKDLSNQLLTEEEEAITLLLAMSEMEEEQQGDAAVIQGLSGEIGHHSEPTSGRGHHNEDGDSINWSDVE